MSMYNLAERSENSKTGPIAVVTSSETTCWIDCPMKDACYGRYGRLGMHFARVTAGQSKNRYNFRALCSKLNKLPVGNLLRYADAGDLPGYRAYDQYINKYSLVVLSEAVDHLHAWCFSHKPILGEGPRRRTQPHLGTIGEESYEGRNTMDWSSTVPRKDCTWPTLR